jgi:hypothetical protein
MAHLDIQGSQQLKKSVGDGSILFQNSLKILSKIEQVHQSELRTGGFPGLLALLLRRARSRLRAWLSATGSGILSRLEG